MENELEAFLFEPSTFRLVERKQNFLLLLVFYSCETMEKKEKLLLRFLLIELIKFCGMQNNALKKAPVIYKLVQISAQRCDKVLSFFN